MSYDLLILAFIMLVFCFLMQYFTVKVMFSLFNSVRPEGAKKIEPILTKKSKKQKEAEKEARKEKERFDTIMRNLDAYDGTEIGQEEVK